MRMSGLALASLVPGVGSLMAADINLTASGAYFASGAGWSNAVAPSAGNAYFTNNYNLLTDISSSNYTFGGDSLTVGSGSGLFVIRTTGTVTFGDLRINGGSVQNWGAYAPAIATLAGKITLTNFGYIRPSEGRNIRVSSVIDGPGALRVRAGKVILNAANGYTGGTLVETDGTYGSSAEVEKDFGLGTGDVVLQSGATLKLSGGTVHNYIGDGASLVLPSGMTAGSVNLAFGGTDRIDALSLNGGTTWVTEGTWGSLTSSATHKNAVFAGNGILQVGPPSMVTNSLGEKFINPWTETFNAARLSSDWTLVKGGAGMALVNGNLALSTYRSGVNKIQPLVRSTFEKLYGRYEAIVYTHTLPGVCNAFYTVKPTEQPAGTQFEWQEIDILEIMGDQTPMQNVIWGTGTTKRSPTATAKIPDGWHMWAMEWTPNNISFYLDGKLLLVKPSDSFQNATARTMYAQKVDISNWIPDLAIYPPSNPVSTMLVDKFTYYELDMKTIQSTAYNAVGGTVTSNGGVVSDLHAGDSLRYNAVNLTGHRNVTFEVASAKSNRTIQVRTGSAIGPIIATVPVPNTGGWGGYDYFTKASANLTATGTADLFFTFTASTDVTDPVASIRNVHFHGSQPTSLSRRDIIHAVDADAFHGDAVASADDLVMSTKDGSYLRFDNIDFTGVTKITLEIARNGPATPAHTISLRLGSEAATPIASTTAPASTGAWRTYQLVDIPIPSVASTSASLWITFECSDFRASAGNLRSIRFTR